MGVSGRAACCHFRLRILYNTCLTYNMDRETDRWVRSEEARAKFRDLLDDVARGDHVYVLRYDKPAAVLVPVGWYEAIKAAAARAQAAGPDFTIAATEFKITDES